MDRTRIVRWVASAAAGSMLALIPLAASSAGAATASICTGHCAWEQLGQPSGYVLDVKGQQAAPGTPIVAWKGIAGNPSEDFTVTHYTAPVASPSLGVSFEHSSDGAAAGWSGGSIVLTPGTVTSSTFGQMDVTSPPSAAPSVAPSFATDNYAAGSPRWVMTFSDGCYLFGYPSQLGGGATADFTGPQWQVNGNCTSSNGQYETYAQAVSDVSPANSATVTSAYIVADGDQAAGTHDTLSGVQYGGLSPVAPSTAPQSGYEIVYTPFTNHAGAAQAANSPNATLKAEGVEATNAYSSSANGGHPLFCVSVNASQNSLATLEPCGQPATIFNGVAGLSNHTLFELAVNHALALNDRNLGGNGSSVIAFATNPSAWNEEFYPGVHNAA